MSLTNPLSNIDASRRMTSTITTGQEREIASYPVGRGLKARILFSGDRLITIESIEKLIKLLELNKEDLPELNEKE